MICQRGGTWFRLALPVLAAALAGFSPLRAQEPAAKKPIPDASSLQQTLTLVEEVYGGEPSGASGGSHRVYRGGFWGIDASYCWASCRRWDDPGYRYGLLGFRLARTVSSSLIIFRR